MGQSAAQYPALESVFTPGIPVVDRDRYVGRPRRLERARAVLEEPGRHLLVLGEAGVGRTSFALCCLGERPHRYHQVSSSDSFELLMRRLLAPEGAVDSAPAADRVWSLVDTPTNPAPVLIIDDVDRAPHEAVTEGITPLLRALADTRSATKVILTARDDRPFPKALAGVGLRLYAVRLDRLDENSLAEIVNKGAALTGLSVEEALRDRIVVDADGLPGMAHALCLEAGRSALARSTRRVTMGRDYLPALSRLVDSMAPRLHQAYAAATATRGKHNRFAHLLWAGALCPGPGFGLDELERQLGLIEAQAVPHQAFATHLGDLLKRGLFSRLREGVYRYTDPAMRAYVRLLLRKEEPSLMGEDPLQLALPY